MRDIISALSTGIRLLKEEGPLTMVREGAYFAWETSLGAVLNLLGKDEGECIYDRDWDILVILDACRHDLMREVEGEYDFISEVGVFRSRGSHSREWMSCNFTSEVADEMKSTAMVTGNPFSSEVLSQTDFQVLDEVWRYGWDNTRGTIWPEPLTDRAIQVWKEEKPDRMIIHYMQPHEPFVGDGYTGQDLENWGSLNMHGTVWQDIRDGRTSQEDVWADYRDNLRYALDAVELLLENVDAERVVLSADHGNGIGEWGVWGHPEGVPTASLRNVPWVVTEATDKETFVPSLTKPDAEEPVDVRERLESLGYVDT